MAEQATATQLLKELRGRGFTADFEPERESLKVGHSSRVLKPEELTICELYRLEGESDPDEMSVIYAIETADGLRGVLIDAFGTYGDPTVGDVLRRVPQA